MNNLDKLLETLKTDNVFLTGGGGVGKSYLCQELIHIYKEEKRHIITLGSTGISAVSIGGQTLHSFFVFGIANTQDEILQNDKKNARRIKELNQILSKCELLIIDEISMVSANILDMIRYRLTNANFNGRLLFVGDFFQLPPITKNSENGLLGDSTYAFESLAWEFYEPKVLALTKPKRTQNFKFFSILNRIRIGDISQNTLTFLQNLREQKEILDQEPTMLFSTNYEVDAMNTKKLYELDGELIVLMAEQTNHDDKVHPQKIEGWKKSLAVNECLELKIGASVLFCTNKKDTYYNGQRGVVLAIHKDSISVEKSNGDVVLVEKHNFKLNEIRLDGDEPKEHCLATFEQYPLKLAYAITIHKSQGMSIDKLVCNIDKIFEKSQLYVALSRATDPNGLFLYYRGNNFEDHISRCIKIDDKVLNFYQNCDIIKLEE